MEKTTMSVQELSAQMGISLPKAYELVKPGDKVIYSKYSGTEVKVEEEDYIIVKQNDILAIVE